MNCYVENRNGGLYVAGTRISLDSVVYAFNRGAAPETILHSFPSVGSLEMVYGAITYYLANRAAVDEYLSGREAKFEELRAAQFAASRFEGKDRGGADRSVVRSPLRPRFQAAADLHPAAEERRAFSQ